MKTEKTLAYIAGTSAPFRRSLANLAKLHSEKECNGEYYYDDEQKKWIGYTGAPEYKHSATNKQAKEGAKREKEIRAKIKELCGTQTIPNFISYGGDPRGFVLKINSDKLTQREIELCHALDFVKDWGGDFAIMKNSDYAK